MSKTYKDIYKNSA